jgi:hypothetical protein
MKGAFPNYLQRKETFFARIILAAVLFTSAYVKYMGAVNNKREAEDASL